MRFLRSINVSFLLLLWTPYVQAMSWEKYNPLSDSLYLKTDAGNSEVVGKVFLLESFPEYKKKMSPDATRIFLQNVINYVGEKGGTLLFPQNQQFVINIPKGTLPGYKNVGGTGLTIPSNVIIDLNGSTITCSPNDFWCYNLIAIPSQSKNICIRNGFVKGERSRHIIPASGDLNKKTHEWNYGFLINGSYCTLKNISVSDFRGDGIVISASGDWNHTKAIKSSSFAKSGKKGIVTFCSPLLKLHNYWSHKYLYVKPAFERLSVDWDFDHSFLVKYFSKDNKYISSEEVNILDHLQPPAKAEFFVFYVKTPQPEKICDFWIMSYDRCEDVLVDSCKVFNCGRNGISTNVVSNCVIRNSHIYNIGGTNNFVGIDIEGTSFISGNLLVDNCRVEKTERGASLVSAQGANIEIRNSRMEGIVGHEGMKIIACNANEIFISSPQKKMYSSDNIYPRNIVENCTVNGPITVWNCDVRGCEMLSAQSKYLVSNYTANTGEFLSSFSGCAIVSDSQLLGPAEYDNCNIDCRGGILSIISTEDSPAIFENCKISASRIARSTMVSFVPYVLLNKCDVSLSGDFCKIQASEIKDNSITIIGDANPIYIYPVNGSLTLSNNRFILNKDNYTRLITIESKRDDKITISDNFFQFNKILNCNLSLFNLTDSSVRYTSRRNTYTFLMGRKSNCMVKKYPGLEEIE